MFNLFQVIFPIFFIVVIGLIVFQAVKGIGRWSHNNRQPVLSVRTRIAAKRLDVSHQHHNNGNGVVNGHSSTTYYVTFEVESGDRMELVVGGNDYGMLAENDIGKLTFQGTRYLGFEREGY